MAHHKCNIHGVHYDLTDWQGGGGEDNRGSLFQAPSVRGGPQTVLNSFKYVSF